MISRYLLIIYIFIYNLYNFTHICSLSLCSLCSLCPKFSVPMFSVTICVCSLHLFCLCLYCLCLCSPYLCSLCIFSQSVSLTQYVVFSICLSVRPFQLASGEVSLTILMSNIVGEYCRVFYNYPGPKWVVPHSDFLAWLSSATLKISISGVSSQILML